MALPGSRRREWDYSKKRMRTIFVMLAMMASITAASYASTSYTIPGGTLDEGNNLVSASTILSLSLVGSQEVLTITLDNLTPNQISDGENITGIEPNINSSQVTGVSLVSSSADLIQVPSKSARNKSRYRFSEPLDGCNIAIGTDGHYHRRRPAHRRDHRRAGKQQRLFERQRVAHRRY
jgi:hypothetical protein